MDVHATQPLRQNTTKVLLSTRNIILIRRRTSTPHWTRGGYRPEENGGPENETKDPGLEEMGPEKPELPNSPNPGIREFSEAI
jgi:hypothetical protein